MTNHQINQEIKIARYCVEISIYDNDTGEQVYGEGTNYSDIYGVELALDKAKEAITNQNNS
jgi:hypothetical protein